MNNLPIVSFLNESNSFGKVCHLSQTVGYIFKNADTQTMAQIGLVCLGIFLADKSEKTLNGKSIAFTSQTVEFHHPVFVIC